MPVALHVNVDHVATLRQARGTPYPDPVEVALACERAGARGITVHLREDRRHIQDADVEQLRARVTTLLNLEMAATDAMVEFALRVRPDVVTLVPERRDERTTEGGLDAAGQLPRLRSVVARLRTAGIAVSLFIDPEVAQVDAAVATGADRIELHTGDYAGVGGGVNVRELERLARAAKHNAGATKPLHLAAGHGLSVDNVGPLLRAVPEIAELNVGHAIVADAIVHGIEGAVRRFLDAMSKGAAR